MYGLILNVNVTDQPFPIRSLWNLVRGLSLFTRQSVLNIVQINSDLSLLYMYRPICGITVTYYVFSVNVHITDPNKIVLEVFICICYLFFFNLMHVNSKLDIDPIPLFWVLLLQKKYWFYNFLLIHKSVVQGIAN